MSIQHLVGFVPQEDTMYRDLTVRETLRFNARLKVSFTRARANLNFALPSLARANLFFALPSLARANLFLRSPRSHEPTPLFCAHLARTNQHPSSALTSLAHQADPGMTRPERRAFVNEVVDILGLKHVQHSVIGDELTRGISGGQRKRVNIGIELMGSPLVLFLDEPTSGLDATTTQLLIDSLEKLAALGLTIAMVIHQPRMEVLRKIQNLILLQKGGHEVYIGPTEDAIPYFKDQLGQDLPDQTSPADFFLDVITEDQNKHDDLAEEGTIVDTWAKYKTTLNFSHDREEYKDRIVPARHRPGRFYQIRTIYKRSVVQIFNAAGLHFVDAMLFIMAGAVAGIVAVDDNFMGNQIVMMINGMISVVAALKVFGGEGPVFLREMNAGVSSFSCVSEPIQARCTSSANSPHLTLTQVLRGQGDVAPSPRGHVPHLLPLHVLPHGVPQERPGGPVPHHPVRRNERHGTRVLHLGHHEREERHQ
jgi:ABC-type multidrug transport system ATPase subunit